MRRTTMKGLVTVAGALLFAHVSIPGTVRGKNRLSVPGELSGAHCAGLHKVPKLALFEGSFAGPLVKLSAVDERTFKTKHVEQFASLRWCTPVHALDRLRARVVGKAL